MKQSQDHFIMLTYVLNLLLDFEINTNNELGLICVSFPGDACFVSKPYLNKTTQHRGISSLFYMCEILMKYLPDVDALPATNTIITM